MTKAKKDYTKGKIYRLVCNTTGLQYIGHTTKDYLSQRLVKHIGDYKSWLEGKMNYVTSFIIIEMNNYEMVLIEKYPCISEDELKARERYWIENLECVNKNIPNRTKIEWTEDNKEKIIEQGKIYREEHKEELKKYYKSYYENHREEKLKYINEYNKENRDRRIEYMKEYIKNKKGNKFSLLVSKYS